MQKDAINNSFLVFLKVIGNSISFAMGLASSLALLGIAASFAGKAYGQVGQGLPVAASFLAVVMGLNLLQVMCMLGATAILEMYNG